MPGAIQATHIRRTNTDWNPGYTIVWGNRRRALPTTQLSFQGCRGRRDFQYSYMTNDEPIGTASFIQARPRYASMLFYGSQTTFARSKQYPSNFTN